MIELIRISSADDGGAVLAECALSGEDVIARDGKIQKRRAFLLLPEQYAELKPKKGPVNPDTLEKLEDCDRKCRAVIAGRRLLGYSSNSAKQLSLKLRRKGIDAESAGFAGEKLLAEGEINENADALRQAERLVASGKGRLRVIAQLKAKSYGTEAINAVSSYLDTVDFSEICRTVVEKKWGKLPADRDERRKCIAALMRLGFSSSDIRNM